MDPIIVVPCYCSLFHKDIYAKFTTYAGEILLLALFSIIAVRARRIAAQELVERIIALLWLADLVPAATAWTKYDLCSRG